MGAYRKNPKKPYIVKVPNKLRKRLKIAQTLDRAKG